MYDLGDTDYNLKNATNGQVLTYNSALGKWTAQDPSGGGGGTIDTYARNHANAAYDYANTIVSDTQVDPYARGHANAAFDSANTKIATTGGSFTGTVTFRDTRETLQIISGATGVVTHNCANSLIFIHDTPTANLTANLVNFTVKFAV